MASRWVKMASNFRKVSNFKIASRWLWQAWQFSRDLNDTITQRRFSKTKPRTWPEQVPGGSLRAFLAPRPEPGQNRPQEARLEHFWPQAQNLARAGPRRLVYSISGPRPRTWPEQLPGGLFRAFLASGPEPGQNMPQEACLELSSSRPRTWPEQVPGSSFRAFLAPGPEPGQNRPQEARLELVWPQAQNLARTGPRRLV